MKHYQLAELNVARIRFPLDDPGMKEFTDFLEPVNKLAEDSPGFVWRLKDDFGRPSSYVDSPYDDKMVLINFSVWKDVESLKYFTYRSVHSYFLRNKTKWFDKMYGHHMVLWWVEKGVIPSIDEALEKLKLVTNIGPSKEAFTFKEVFEPL